MTLLELQRRMAEDVRRPLTDDFAMQSVTDDGASVEELAESYMKPNDRLTSFERLEIYNRQYWFRVIGSVGEDYPALLAVMGSKRFDAMVLAYLKENPSTSFTLRNLGAKLPVWLAGHRELTGSRHALALDVARLEWAYVDAFDSARRKPLDEADFIELGPETVLRLQPHLQLLELSYPVDELVLAVRAQTPEASVASNAVSEPTAREKVTLPKMHKQPVWLAVHRFDDSVYYRRIDREAFLLLGALRDGVPVAEALGVAFGSTRISAEEQAAKIQEYFAHAAELGWFCRAADYPA
jgi:hypothetical protein